MSLRVLLVTTWNTACGISEHSAYLREAVEAADPSISVFPCAEMLDPHHAAFSPATVEGADIFHLNYQAALHSRWTPRVIEEVRRNGVKVLVTYHDSGVPNSDQCKAICDAADAAVVHEPFDDLPAEKVRYWRMGVPDWTGEYRFDTKRRPLLGTIGFPFPWKNFDKLAEVTAVCGWDLLLIAPGATAEQEATWKQLNPRTSICTTFLPRELAGEWLAGCDASAFCYTCANTGQSGAVLQGIAARKPVIALSTCRQFRALFDDTLGRTAITWAETFEDVAFALQHFTRIERVCPAMVALAEQDSWSRLGVKYAQLYKELADA